MKIPAIIKQEPLAVAAGISKLSKLTFDRNPHPALLKEPAQFWDEVFIANEAHILDEVTHPRIRHKLAYDAGAQRLFLEYIEAETLQDLVLAGVTLKDPRRTHRILQCLAETLADMHAGILCGRPIVHNDLKSLNVLVPAAPSSEAILIDFSHSYFDGQLPSFLTDKKHNPAGTAKYMAPEKWAGNFAHGFKSDVFAFGVMAYFAYTGRHPFEGDITQIEEKIRAETPPSPLDLDVHVVRNIIATVMLCLEKQPNRRPTMEHIARSYADSASLFN